MGTQCLEKIADKVFGSYEEAAKDDNVALAAVELISRYSELGDEVTDRMNRYRLYDAFFTGDNQWCKRNRAEGRNKFTINICEPTCRKYSALLAASFPKISIPRLSENDPFYDIITQRQENFAAEFNQSEAKEKILREVLFDDNDIDTIFASASLTGSWSGDTILYSFRDKDGKIRIQEIFPGDFRARFTDSSFLNIEHCFITKTLSLRSVERLYNYKANADIPGETLNTGGTHQYPVKDMYLDLWNATKLLKKDYAVVRYYYDDEYHGILVNGKLVFYPGTQKLLVKHGLPHVPFWWIPNKKQSYRNSGESDLKQIIEIQEAINTAISDEADIVSLFANPKVIGKGLTTKEVQGLRANRGNLIKINAKASLDPFQFNTQIYPVEQRIQNLMDKYHMVSGLPPIAFGAAQGSIVTGVALTAQFAPTLQTLRAKTNLWNSALTNAERGLIPFILKVLEKFGGTHKESGIAYKDIINEKYNVKLLWENRVPKDDSIYINNELQKLGARLQSRMTTMGNIGLDSPEDEMKVIAWEELHPFYSPEKEMARQQAMATLPKGADEEIDVAVSENVKLASGQELPSTAGSPDGHLVHIKVHSNALDSGAVTDFEIIKIFDKHIAGHEQASQSPGTTTGASPATAPSTEGEVPGNPAAAGALEASLPGQVTGRSLGRPPVVGEQGGGGASMVGGLGGIMG